MPRALVLLSLTLLACEPADDSPPATTRSTAPVFETETIDDDVAIGYGLAVGDVDGDGDADILLADKTAFVWYRNPEWTRFVMVENLTERDNVCLAARDIDGDGQVEVAVGAQWNPGETDDPAQSGTVHYLVRPDDPTARWTPVQLPHEPTIHRMRWARAGPETYHLVVAPLHGRGNRGGEGAGVRLLAYVPPDDPADASAWTTRLLDDRMHKTHNIDIVEADGAAHVYIAGAEGVARATAQNGGWAAEQAELLGLPVRPEGAGEVRVGVLGGGRAFVTAIEPMHGTDLAVYIGDAPARTVLDTTFNQGHALVADDFLGRGYDQIAAGWRNPDADGKVGVRLYVPDDPDGASWTTHLIDDNGMAAEDLRAADLDADGRLDLIAAGRATNNLKVYWNRTPS